MRCSVFGTGYLGATHAAGMAELGHDVIGVDIDYETIGSNGSMLMVSATGTAVRIE